MAKPSVLHVLLFQGILVQQQESVDVIVMIVVLHIAEWTKQNKLLQ